MHAINLIQALSEPADQLLRAICQVHKLHEVEEALQRDHLILLARVEWLTNRGIILEVIVQLKMVDREQRHRRIEVFLLLVEVQVHRTEVHLKLGRVLLLLEQLLLRLSLLPGLSLLKFFLGLTGITFLFFVVFFFLVIQLLLLLSADGLWSAVVAEVDHVLLGEIRVLTCAII